MPVRDGSNALATNAVKPTTEAAIERLGGVHAAGSRTADRRRPGISPDSSGTVPQATVEERSALR